MPEDKSVKKDVWKNIYRLVVPYRKKLYTIFLLSLMATSVTLIEPLIYREAVNDVAGLFLQQAQDDAAGNDAEQDDISSFPFFDRLMGEKKPMLVTDTINYTYDTIHYLKDTIIVKTLKAGAHGNSHHKRTVTLKHKEKIPASRIVKEPHTRTHVAPRTPSQAFDTLLWAVVALFIINIVGLIFWWIGENLHTKLACIIERNFIARTFGHVLRLPLSFFSKHSTAALQQRIDQSEEISDTVSYFIKEILPEIISLVGILLIMFWQNYVLTLLALSIIPLYLFLTVRSTKRLNAGLSRYYEKWEKVSATMQDALVGVKTVKLSGAETREMLKLDDETDQAYRDYIKRTKLANRYAFWQVLLTHIASAFVLSYGGYLALNHQLTPGDVVMFVAYLDMLYDPIDNLSEIWAGIQENVTSISRAFKLLDVATEEKHGKELVVDNGKVEFREVEFGYTPERKILQNISFTAEPGKVTAIVGASGAGKTTTVDLLLKLFRPQKGEILIDGQQLSEMDDASVRRSIGMVNADGAIFRGTLADNIRYKRPDATDAEVEAAAMAAGMQSTLQRLPDGLRTEVGESGFGLSVGERQRVQIARVIVDKPKILILDEATANLDFATEAEVKRTVEEIRKTNTVIVIAHRFSMVKDADHVIVLEEGQIIEEGAPADLIENGGWFSDFANGGEEDEEMEEEDIEEEDTEEEL